MADSGVYRCRLLNAGVAAPANFTVTVVHPPKYANKEIITAMIVIGGRCCFLFACKRGRKTLSANPKIMPTAIRNEEGRIIVEPQAVLTEINTKA